MNKKYKYVIFDLDRTLWDFDRVSKEVLEELFLEMIKPHSSCSFDFFHNKYSIINSGLWEKYRENQIEKEFLRVKRFSITLEEIGLDRPWIANEMAEQYIIRTANKSYLFPGALDILKYLKGKEYIMAVMTNGFKEVQYPKIERSGLYPYFKYFFISEEVGYNKPDIRIFNFALKEMNASAEQVVFVGDDYEVDIEGAASAGIDQIFFNPQILADLNRRPATYCISALIELKKIL